MLRALEGYPPILHSLLLSLRAEVAMRRLQHLRCLTCIPFRYMYMICHSGLHIESMDFYGQKCQNDFFLATVNLHNVEQIWNYKWKGMTTRLWAAVKVTVWCLVMNNSWVNENTVSSSSELNHLFIADSLQLTNPTSRFGQQALQLPFHLRN